MQKKKMYLMLRKLGLKFKETFWKPHSELWYTCTINVVHRMTVVTNTHLPVASYVYSYSVLKDTVSQSYPFTQLCLTETLMQLL